MYSYIVETVNKHDRIVNQCGIYYSHEPISKGDEIELYGDGCYYDVSRVLHGQSGNGHFEPTLRVEIG